MRGMQSIVGLYRRGLPLSPTKLRCMNRVVLVLMLLMGLLMPNAVWAQTASLREGRYQAHSTSLIQIVTVTETGLELDINAEQLAQQPQVFQALVTANQRAISKKIKPNMTSQEIEQMRQDLGLDLEAYQQALEGELVPDKLVEVLENQVSGVYAHVRETGQIFLRITQPKLSQTGDTVRVRVIDEEILSLTEVSDTGFTLDQVSFVKE